MAAAGCFSLVHPAAAQVIDDRFPFLENRQRRYQQQQNYQQWNHQQFNQQQPGTREAPVESARVPPPRRPDQTPAVNVMVFGDSMAEWLAYGLEEAFAETPEIGVTRKPRLNTGLIRVETRGESYDWPQSAREILNAEKPDYVVMMIGVNDRRGIREALKPQPARTPAAQKQNAQPNAPAQAATPAQSAQPQAPAQPPSEATKKPIDNEAPPESAQEQQQPSIVAPETAVSGSVVREFRSEEWGELYSKRVDETIAVLKARGVPVFWVGLPSIRGTRSTSEMVYLNDLYRGRAEKAGITYVDIWDGFVDEAGNYNNYGPDFEGQTRRLRAGRRREFHPRRRAQARALRRARNPARDAGARPFRLPCRPRARAGREGAADRRGAGSAAAPGREPGDVADRATRRRRRAARRSAGAQFVRGFRRDARAGEGRADRGAARPGRRFCLAAPRRDHGDRRAAARSGRAAAKGRSAGDRRRTNDGGADEAGIRAA